MPGCLLPPLPLPLWGPYTQECAVTSAPPPALECVSLEGCLPSRGYAPSPFGAFAPPSPEDRGFILSPHPVFYCSHPWSIRLTRHCAWRRMECGGVGVGGGFPFTFWLAHYSVLAHTPLTYFWQLFLLTLLPAREAHFSLRLVTSCTTGMAPILSLHRGFGTSLFPHGLRPIV